MDVLRSCWLYLFQNSLLSAKASRAAGSCVIDQPLAHQRRIARTDGLHPMFREVPHDLVRRASTWVHADDFVDHALKTCGVNLLRCVMAGVGICVAGHLPGVCPKRWRRKQIKGFGVLICFHGQNGMSSSMSSNPLGAGLPAAWGAARFFIALNSGDASILVLRPLLKVSNIFQSGSAKRNI